MADVVKSIKIESWTGTTTYSPICHSLYVHVLVTFSSGPRISDKFRVDLLDKTISHADDYTREARAEVIEKTVALALSDIRGEQKMRKKEVGA